MNGQADENCTRERLFMAMERACREMKRGELIEERDAAQEWDSTLEDGLGSE